MHVGEGNCTKIPQLENTAASARTRAAPAACATAFPTAVKGGLLFVWMVPGADGLLQSLQCAYLHLGFLEPLNTPSFVFSVHKFLHCTSVSAAILEAPPTTHSTLL